MSDFSGIEQFALSAVLRKKNMHTSCRNCNVRVVLRCLIIYAKWQLRE